MKRYLILLLMAILGLCQAFSQSLTTTYEYDELNRLVKVSYPNGQRVQFEYDVLGNRTSMTVTQDTYLVTATVVPEAAGTVEGAGNYAPNTQATLVATANEGYSFANWTENGETVSTAATYTFTVNGARNLVANFTQATYAVTATAAPENGGTITGAGTYVHGDTVTLATSANAGYTFINWTENGEVVSAEPTCSFVVTAAHMLVANFSMNSYAVSVEATPEEGGTVTGEGVFNYGATATLTATANPGYTFYNWTMNGQQVSTNATYTFTVTTQATYVAHFTLNTYLITAIPNPTTGGTVSGGGNYAHGSTVTLIAAPNDNYEFVNWTKNGQQVSDSVTYSFPVQESGTYIAHFTLKSYAITATANPEAGGTVTGAGDYVFGTTATLAATANEGYTFLNWTQDGEEVSTEPTYSFEVTGAAAFVANFELNSYEITATANPEAGGTVEGAGTYDHGATATLTATANEGYSFTNWTKNGTAVSAEATYSFTVTEASAFVANFALNSYGIAATANPSVGGTVTGAGNYDYGTTATLTATAATGYIFVNWTEDGNQVSSEAAYSFTVTGARVLVANFTASSYLISATVVPENSGTITGAGGYEYGQTCTLTATANEGYTFLNWTLDGSAVSTEATYSFTVTGDASYVANFSLNSYEITTTANPEAGGTVEGAGSYDHGATATLTATANAGYTFINWTKAGVEVSTEATYSFTVTEAAVFVANFELNSYEITATANPTEGGTINGAGTYDHGATATLVATANEGYTFMNWTKDGTVVSTSSTYSFTVTEASGYVANFTLNGYAITAMANPDAGGTVEGAGTYEYGATVTLTAATNTGYTFLNWTENGTIVSTSLTYTFMVTETASYVANFALNSYEISVTSNPEAGGMLTGAGTYGYGTSVTLTAMANSGYTFFNWTLGGLVVSYEPTYSFTVTEATEYVANFTLNGYEITAEANPEEGGTVTGSGTYDYGTTATLTATSNEGYTFVNWTENGSQVSANAEYAFTVTGDRALVANFTASSFVVLATVVPENSGTITGSGGYEYGQTCILTATANEGYTFINWIHAGSVVSTEATYSFEVTGDATYVATFELNSYVITATANPEMGGIVSGAGTYNHGETAILAVTANEGYTFTNWKKDGEEVSTSATYTFTVTEAGDYVANFELNTYEITATANPTEGGTVSGAGTYDHGMTCTLTAIANEGYTFTNWTKDGTVVSANATYSFIVTEAGGFVVNFELNSYAITATAVPEAGGTVEGAGTYNHGETATLTATANAGYTFTNWTKDGAVVSTNATYSFTVTEAAAFVANFTLNSYDITVMANPAEGGTVSGAGTYSHGTTCTLTATANEGYAFINWTKNGTVVSTNATYSFTVIEAGNYVANFEITAITQVSGFVQGWNWWSSYVELDGANSLQSLQNGLGTSGMMMKSQNDGYASYLAGFGWYGSLTTINNENTYQIRVNEPCSIEMTGGMANPFEHPITLNTGWTWVGYPVAVSMGVSEAFSGIAPQSSDMLKSQNDGFASYLEGFGWYGSLNTLHPGMGLMFKSNNSENITLTYPDGGPRTDLKANQTADNNLWQPNLNAYPDNMSVMAVVELDGNELEGENYELAAFANGEVRGSARLLYVEPIDRYLAFLTIAGEDASELRFALFNVETGEEYENSRNLLTFAANAVAGSFAEPYIVSFRSMTGADEWAENLQIYPNPIDRGQSLKLGLNGEGVGEMKVEIINTMGVVLDMVQSSSLLTLTAPTVSGTYTLRITIEGKGVCHRKLIVR